MTQNKTGKQKERKIKMNKRKTTQRMRKKMITKVKMRAKIKMINKQIKKITVRIKSKAAYHNKLILHKIQMTVIE